MDIITKIKSKKTKFILSFISAVIFQLGIIIIMVSCNFTVYFLSYIHYKDEWVDMNYGNLMRPFFLLFFAIFSPLSGPMEQFFGIRIALLISSIIVEVAFTLLYFQRNLWFLYSLTFFLGLGNGLSNQILTKNACFFYPERKGLISALIASIGSLFGASYSFLGEKIINPEREEIFRGYYRAEIAERSKLFFLFAMILIPSSTLLSIFLLYKYIPESSDNIDEERKEIENNIKEVQGPIVKEMSEEEAVENEEENENNKEITKLSDKSNEKQIIKKFLKKWRFWRVILIVGIMPFMIWFETATSRPYCSLLGVDGNVIGILTGSLGILSCFTNLIWGFTVDKIGFRPIILTISSLTICLSIYFFIFMNNKIFYVIGIYISGILRGGITSSVMPHIMQIFGLKNYLIIGGLGRLFAQLFSFGAACVSIVISIFKKEQDELLTPYRIVCAFSCGFSIFGLFLSYFENDEKFEFESE